MFTEAAEHAIDGRDDSSSVGSERNEACETDSPPTHLQHEQEQARSSNVESGLTYQWLKDIATRVSALEDRQVAQVEQTQTGDVPSNFIGRTRPEVRDCDWRQFKNRFSDGECGFAIETLLAGPDLDGEMEKEQLERIPFDKRKDYQQRKSKRRPPNNKGKNLRQIERVRINSEAILGFLGKVMGEPTWSGRPYTFLRPFRMMRHYHPKLEDEFKKLQQIFEKEEAEELTPGETLSVVDAGSTTTNSAEGPPEHVSPKAFTSRTLQSEDTFGAGHNLTINTQSPSGGLDGPTDSANMYSMTPTLAEYGEMPISDRIDGEQYEEIKCYMDFFRTRLLSEQDMFEDNARKARAKVHYADLWALFQIGQLVVEPSYLRNVSAKFGPDNRSLLNNSQQEPKVMRVCQILLNDVDWKVDNLETPGGLLRREAEVDATVFEVSAYYIDFDGEDYTSVTRTYSFLKFDGEKDITKLELYPLTYHAHCNQVKARLQKQGERFHELLLRKYMAVEYDGWTLGHDPIGDTVKDASSVIIPTEYISSDAIIDFKEAYHRHPHWNPAFSRYNSGAVQVNTEFDGFPIIQWSDKDRSQAVSQITEVVVDKDDIVNLQFNELLAKDDFLASDEFRDTEIEISKKVLQPEDYILFPRRLFVYSLRDRKFVNADVHCLKEVRPMSDPFKNLKILADHEKVIKAAVRDHFEKKIIQQKVQSKGEEFLEQDFIRGKGRGLVMLLHGAPGVGKTATAEAIALSHQKPLFRITCGDLGHEPKDVESNLAEVFRLASRWDCILLLDEAEVFLTRREKNDDRWRNMLVTMFLRTIEYYHGILFLTTNRVGVLDEAINSRVHCSFFFPPLGVRQTLALFSMHVKNSQTIADQRAAATGEAKLIIQEEDILDFATQSFQNRAVESGGRTPWWNGRQIRNAFQIATSLAYADSGKEETGSKRPRYLGREHFEQTQTLVDAYDAYRQSIFHKTDNELSENREERSSLTPGNTSGTDRRHDSRYEPRLSPKFGPRLSPSHPPFGQSPSYRGVPDRASEQDPISEGHGFSSPTPRMRESHYNSYHSHRGEDMEQYQSSDFNRGGYDNYARHA